MPPVPPAARRSVLQLGLAGGALLSLGGIGFIGLRATKLGPPPRIPLRALDLKEFAVVSAIANCMLPSCPTPTCNAGDPQWPTAASLQCAEKIDGVMASLHPEAVAEFKQLLGLFENGISGLLTHRRPTPFTQLSDEEQRERLNAWRHCRLSLLRSGYLALTRLVHATYYSSPDVYAAMGYPGPPQGPFVPEAAPDADETQ